MNKTEIKHLKATVGDPFNKRYNDPIWTKAFEFYNKKSQEILSLKDRNKYQVVLDFIIQ